MALIVPIRPNQYPWQLLLLADPCRGLVEKYLTDALVLASTDGGEILGVVVITSLSHSSWEIKNLAVSPAHQGRGLGKALLRSALDLSKARGAHEVWIGTGNSSLNQLGLYQRMGFRMVEIVQDFFTQHCAEEVVENGIPCRDMVRLVMTFPTEES